MTAGDGERERTGEGDDNGIDGSEAGDGEGHFVEWVERDRSEGLGTDAGVGTLGAVE